MELWVRSRNKEKIEIARKIEVGKGLDDETYVWINNEAFGTYKTKERALEILNEIQKLIQPINVLYNAEIDKETSDKIKEYGMVIVKDNTRIEKLYDSIVYSMPEE